MIPGGYRIEPYLCGIMKPYVKIPLIYGVIALLWIFLSDKLLELYFPSFSDYQLVQTLKGWLFVIVTAFLLGGLIFSEYRKQEKLTNHLQDRQELLRLSNEELRRANQETIQLAHRLAEAEERERKALAQELHDRVGQSLTAMNILLNLISSQLPQAISPDVFARIKDVQSLVEETMIQIRDVMAALRPPVIDEYGLGNALVWLAEHFEKRTGVVCHAECNASMSPLSSRTEIALYRIAQSALDNVAKHASASHVTIKLEESGELVRLIVEDNGKGFDVAEVDRSGGAVHWGLKIMRERAHAVGGVLELQSSRNDGTRLTVTVNREGN